MRWLLLLLCFASFCVHMCYQHHSSSSVRVPLQSLSSILVCSLLFALLGKLTVCFLGGLSRFSFNGEWCSFFFFLSFFLFIGKFLANLYHLFTLSNPLFQLLLLVLAELEVMMSGCQLCHHYINQYRDLFGFGDHLSLFFFFPLFSPPPPPQSSQLTLTQSLETHAQTFVVERDDSFCKWRVCVTCDFQLLLLLFLFAFSSSYVFIAVMNTRSKSVRCAILGSGKQQKSKKKSSLFIDFIVYSLSLPSSLPPKTFSSTCFLFPRRRQDASSMSCMLSFFFLFVIIVSNYVCDYLFAVPENSRGENCKDSCTRVLVCSQFLLLLLLL